MHILDNQRISTLLVHDDGGDGGDGDDDGDGDDVGDDGNLCLLLAIDGLMAMNESPHFKTTFASLQ